MTKAQLPLTPATTPFHQNIHQNRFSRTAQSSPIKKHADKNIKAPCPISMQRGRSLEGIFEGHDHETDIPSPPGTAPLIPSSTFEVAEMPMPQSMSSQALPMTFTYSNGSHASLHASSRSGLTARDQDFQAGADGSRTPLFDEIGTERPILDTNIPILPSSQPGTGCSSPTKTELSPRRMSISDLNLEPGVSASIEETNITLDDIAQFIEGPDPIDNKWVCKYEDCNKKFGRKENIKSHVQTHLGDRQFRCDHCNKCFVRGHDLKRHAKIHTGSKPYPCLCGNAFARHDALTRHRQRGNCIGAFEGVVKKVVKKGRPRKHRPEMDDRLEKANRTRKRVEEKGHHYASSTTDSSVSSFGSPPTETMESLSIRGGSPFDDMSLFGVIAQPMADVTGFPPDLFTFTPPASPGYSTGNKPSPYHRALTPTDMAEVPEISSIQTQLLTTISQEPRHQSPPSLCHSSSSPVADAISFDFSSGEPSASSQRLSLKETSNADFDSFFDYGNMAMEGGQDSFFNL
jgi:regulatory protein SWI5